MKSLYSGITACSFHSEFCLCWSLDLDLRVRTTFWSKVPFYQGKRAKKTPGLTACLDVPHFCQFLKPFHVKGELISKSPTKCAPLLKMCMHANDVSFSLFPLIHPNSIQL